MDPLIHFLVASTNFHKTIAFIPLYLLQLESIRKGIPMNVRKINIILFLLLAWVENHVLPANGDLDPRFDTDGKVTTSFGAASEGHAVAIQSDGKIVVAGVAVVSGVGHFGLARYNTNGSLDATFGTGGLVTTSFGTTDKAYGV